MKSFKINQYKTVAFHAAFWLLFIVYTGVDSGGHGRHEWSFHLETDDFFDIFMSMLVVYINLYVLMPLFYSKEKYKQYFIALLCVLIIFGLIDGFYFFQIWMPLEHMENHGRSEPTDWVSIIGNALRYFPVLALTVLIKMMFDANAREKKLREIEKEKFTAEMGLLKAQINPHFFFNTLNSLYSLSLAGSKKSADLVLRLSDLMRYMLYETSANLVLLKDEIAYLENYLSIEQMRFADRLDLSFKYSGDIAGKYISPLLLLPFIENAFKHGIEDSSGWITIDLKVEGDRLYLKVENSYITPSKTKKPGLGLANVKRRLELAYPGKYHLDIRKNEDIYSVQLTLAF